MKKILILVISVFFVSTAVQAVTFGANLELAMPMGDFADWANMGFGGTVQAEYEVNEMIIATGSVGYLMWSGKDAWEDMDYKWSCIPIKAGGKYLIGDSGLYGIFELGMYMFTIKADYDSPWGSFKIDESESEFGFAPGIGYQMPLGNNKLDISLQYEIAGDFDFLGIDVGIRF